MLTRRHFIMTSTALFSAPIAYAQDEADAPITMEEIDGALAEEPMAQVPNETEPAAPAGQSPVSNPGNWDRWDAQVTPAGYDPATSNPWGLPTRFLPRRVEANPGLTPGDLHVDAVARYLYHIEPGGGTAMRYGVAIARGNLYEPGTYRIGRKAKWPTWTPTQAMIRRDPQLYAGKENGVNGGPTNPLGSRAFYLYQGSRDTYLRIHGSPAPKSIGGRASSGCVRMVMAHINDLYPNVSTGSMAILYPPEDMLGSAS
ncbi:L,D-transpeptidase [Maritimibacter sp. DP1N21-5]|uniref:L,D-transpeptidase n=1 Tax=Maritimibacter sp. DP1N21-5 TaxID=2836867 RepID=UPI001C436ED2|nr:L,D-transpeptidase [Maritimibacter sp. DP1N21-5]MBV7408111.1 L,D-transpeptidase [Maritimibacter sp. DP1N21-5]